MIIVVPVSSFFIALSPAPQHRKSLSVCAEICTRVEAKPKANIRADCAHRNGSFTAVRGSNSAVHSRTLLFPILTWVQKACINTGAEETCAKRRTALLHVSTERSLCISYGRIPYPLTCRCEALAYIVSNIARREPWTMPLNTYHFQQQSPAGKLA